MLKAFLCLLLLAATRLNSSLPPEARQILDRNFPGWHLLKIPGVPDTINLNSHYPYSNFFTCELNGDSISDYALAISTGSDSIIEQHFIALVSSDPGYRLFRLIEFRAPKAVSGQAALVLEPKGTKIPDFTGTERFDIIEDADSLMVTFKTDAITYLPLQGCCSSTFVFERGKFRSFISSD